MSRLARLVAAVCFVTLASPVLGPDPRAIRRPSERSRRSPAPLRREDPLDHRPRTSPARRARAAWPPKAPATSAARDLGEGWKISPSVVVKPGETFTLADIDGPRRDPADLDDAHGHTGASASCASTGTARRRRPSSARSATSSPAAGRRYAQVSSLAVCVNPGSAFNCYWEMPFRKRCRITLRTSPTKDDDPLLPDQLHADRRRPTTRPTSTRSSAASIRCRTRTSTRILDGVRGQGHYVGTYMAWGVNNTGWWGEGEIKFYMDGDKEFPTICGTGTEDYFCGSYNFENKDTKQYQEFTHALRGPAAGHPARRPLPVAAALRPVPLAHHGPDPLREGPARDHPGPGLAQRRPLPAAPGRHRLGRLLVSDGAARAVPEAPAQGRARDPVARFSP